MQVSDAMTCHLSDAKIWAAIQAMADVRGWQTPSLLIDTVAEREGIDRDRVADVFRARTTMQGAG